jgi:serine/threonine protein phosphatase PrpC
VISYFTHTEPGGHEANEDRLAVVSVSSAFLCALADGQGGQAGGAAAAEAACQTCIKTAASFRLDQLLSPLVWPSLLRSSDEAVARNPVAGYTTLIAFCLTENEVCGASSGDSAVLLLNAGEPPLILTKHQIKNPPVGSGAAVFVPFTSRLISPWTVLAMTDGVWKYAGWQAIVTAAEEESGEAIIRRIRDKAALVHTGRLQDDFTLVLFQG